MMYGEHGRRPRASKTCVTSTGGSSSSGRELREACRRHLRCSLPGPPRGSLTGASSCFPRALRTPTGTCRSIFRSTDEMLEEFSLSRVRKRRLTSWLKITRAIAEQDRKGSSPAARQDTVRPEDSKTAPRTSRKLVYDRVRELYGMPARLKLSRGAWRRSWATSWPAATTSSI